MTAEQKERVLGRVLMGQSVRDALEGIASTDDLVLSIDQDAVFRDALSAAQTMRVRLTQLLDETAG
jgi:hypothetical protein